MRAGIFRIITVNLICFLIIFYSGFSVFSSDTVKSKSEEKLQISATEKSTETKDLNSSSKSSEITEKKTESAVSAESESTTPVSAEAVKGKIISQYNSPYKAALSYDGVYVKNNTELKISIKDYLSGKINFKIKKEDAPQVLILHTHATETFMSEDSTYYTEEFSSRTRDDTKNMVAVGKIVAEKLNNAGFKTLHDTTQHDYPSYTASYSRAAKTINSYLKKYPSIKIVLDLHRDAVSSGEKDKVKLVTEIDGKKAAQVMIVMGSQSGNVTNFPNWEENFKLAVKLQQTIEKNYPTLARPLMLMSKNYNESLTTGSLLIEFGTDANSLQEVFYSAEMVGESLVKLLNTLG